MSHFRKETVNPKTGKTESAFWLDNLFGHREYGVVFPSDVGKDDWETLDMGEAKNKAYRTDEVKKPQVKFNYDKIHRLAESIREDMKEEYTLGEAVRDLTDMRARMETSKSGVREILERLLASERGSGQTDCPCVTRLGYESCGHSECWEAGYRAGLKARKEE